MLYLIILFQIIAIIFYFMSLLIFGILCIYISIPFEWMERIKMELSLKHYNIIVKIKENKHKWGLLSILLAIIGLIFQFVVNVLK